MSEPVSKPNEDQEPSLLEQTMELGRTLKAISEEDPAGKPSALAVAVFHAWIEFAGPQSTQPTYFEDVAVNFDREQNSNKDLFTLFDMLANYIAEEELPPLPPSTFIGLPMVGMNPSN
jgi:hypothetical protein